MPLWAAWKGLKTARRLLPLLLGLLGLFGVAFSPSFFDASDAADESAPRFVDQGTCLPTDMVAILATIKFVESGGNYSSHPSVHPGSDASGAYQFLSTTWDLFEGYSEAWLAPAAVQDAKAVEYVTAILARPSVKGDVSLIGVNWYLGHTPIGAEWDTVPPANWSTPREYRDKWVKEYEKNLAVVSNGCVGPEVPSGPFTPSGDVVTIDEGGRNGVCRAFLDICQVDRNWAPYLLAGLKDARAAGIDLEVRSAYRSDAEQASLRIQNCGDLVGTPPQACRVITARVGQSNHREGLAVDLQWRRTEGPVLVGDTAWNWLKAHGERYRMLNHIGAADSVHWSTSGS